MSRHRGHAIHVCCFSALDDLKPKDRGDLGAVLRVLDKAGRFSVFEATEHQKLAGTLDALPKMGLAVYEPQNFPWTKVTLTDAGRARAYGEHAGQPQRRAGDAG